MPTTREQLAAYRASQYAVLAQPELVLRIGERSAPLDRLLEAAGARSAAFVTAANPHSEPRPAGQNLAALARLEGDLAPWRVLRGEGRSADGKWREPSLLVIGIAREEAQALGRRYGQNAIVFVEQGAAAELVLLE
jgi:hypothetical protein